VIIVGFVVALKLGRKVEKLAVGDDPGFVKTISEVVDRIGNCVVVVFLVVEVVTGTVVVVVVAFTGVLTVVGFAVIVLTGL